MNPLLRSGSGIRNRFFPDPGSRIPDPKPFFLELIDNFLGKKCYYSLIIGPHFSLAFQSQNNLQFCEICGYIKRSDNKYFFNPFSFVAVFVSGIRDG